MTVDGPVHPSAEPWVVSIHESADDFRPLGAGVLVAPDRVLTCAHVIMGEGGVVRDRLWVGFPKAAGFPRRLVRSPEYRYEPPVRGEAVRDLAVLALAESAPVEPAPLRCPPGEVLRGKRWWAFGFPDRHQIGNSADGQVGEALGLGWVRLDTRSRYQWQL